MTSIFFVFKKNMNIFCVQVIQQRPINFSKLSNLPDADLESLGPSLDQDFISSWENVLQTTDTTNDSDGESWRE